MDGTPESFATALASGETDRVDDAIDEVETVDAGERPGRYPALVDALADLEREVTDGKWKHVEQAQDAVERVDFLDSLLSDVDVVPVTLVAASGGPSPAGPRTVDRSGRCDIVGIGRRRNL